MTALSSSSSSLKHSAALRCRSFSEKNIEKKHLRRHDKNYCYFCKSNIPVINSIVGSRNLINKRQEESFLPNTDNFLAFFIVFEWGRILKSAMDK